MSTRGRSGAALVAGLLVLAATVPLEARAGGETSLWVERTCKAGSVVTPVPVHGPINRAAVIAGCVKLPGNRALQVAAGREQGLECDYLTLRAGTGGDACFSMSWAAADRRAALLAGFDAGRGRLAIIGRANPGAASIAIRSSESLPAKGQAATFVLEAGGGKVSPHRIFKATVPAEQACEQPLLTAHSRSGEPVFRERLRGWISIDYEQGLAAWCRDQVRGSWTTEMASLAARVTTILLLTLS